MTEKLWTKVRAGDRIRIRKSNDIRPGTYRVGRVDHDLQGNSVREGIYLDGEGWIKNGSVLEIVERDGKPYVAAPTAADTRPIWEQVLKGDEVRVQGSSNIRDGNYIVERTDSDLTGGPDSAGVILEGIFYVRNDTVKEILTRDGKPFGQPAAVDTRPLWEQVLVGDKIKVKGDDEVRDGKYKVLETDHALTAGPDRPGIRVKTPDGSYGQWIYNKTAVAIVERDGKPYAQPAASTAVPAAVPAVTAEPLWKSVKVGDQIELAAVSDEERAGRRTTRTAGIYTVDQLDTSDPKLPIRVKTASDNLWVIPEKILRIVPKENGLNPLDRDTILTIEVGDRIKVKGSSYVNDGEHEVMALDFPSRHESVKVKDLVRGTWWVGDQEIFGLIKKGTPAATTTQVQIPDPAWKRAKVGDVIRVSRGGDHDAGDFEVVQVSSYPSTSARLAVKYKQYDHWWIDNSKVELIVTDKPTGAVRGNFLLHVDVPTIMSNRAAQKHDPVIVARKLNELAKPELFRELAWDGPTRFVHHHFQRIEGTDIQNWVETDAPLTCWRDGEAIRTMDAVSPASRQHTSLRPMTQPILGGFVIHIAAPVLMKNRQEGRNDPVIAVRKAFTNWATDVVFARRVEWNGPSRMVHRPSTPIPGTEGRGVSFVETDADVTVWLDDGPQILRMPALRAAA